VFSVYLSLQTIANVEQIIYVRVRPVITSRNNFLLADETVQEQSVYGRHFGSELLVSLENKLEAYRIASAFIDH